MRCCGKELLKSHALKSVFLSRVQGGLVDNGRFSGDNDEYLNQLSMSSTVKNIESSSNFFVFFIEYIIELGRWNRKNIVRTSKPIFLTLKYERLLKDFRMLTSLQVRAPFKELHKAVAVYSFV